MNAILPLISLVALSAPTQAQANPNHSINQTIASVEQMVWDDQANQLAAQHGLDLVNVTWEDTGRSKGSSWGPNISDMTIGVRDSQGLLHPMPVLRFDNFTDVTADVRSDRFWLLTGNEDDRPLNAVNLQNVLTNTRSFLTDSRSWAGSRQGLWDDRDTHVLVSAQACFLPVPQHGEATFTPVLYNYQSYPDNPAVLTIVATREGTSIQVIENDNGYMSEPLFFNTDGQRAPFTAVRKSDWEATGGDGGSGLGWRDQQVVEGMHNVVLVIQVPLKHTPRHRGMYMLDEVSSGGSDAPMPAAARNSNVEEAVIGHGEVEGPFEEIAGLDIERDDRFPVRVTVQFYQATSNGIINSDDVANLRAQIDRVYADAAFVGSLVTEGYTNRPTEWVTPTPTARWHTSPWGWLKPN